MCIEKGQFHQGPCDDANILKSAPSGSGGHPSFAGTRSNDNESPVAAVAVTCRPRLVLQTPNHELRGSMPLAASGSNLQPVLQPAFSVRLNSLGGSRRRLASPGAARRVAVIAFIARDSDISPISPLAAVAMRGRGE
jgi:hypothetical protein